MHTHDTHRQMTRPAMLAYTVIMLSSLKCQGIRVTRRRKLFWAAIRQRWNHGQDLFVAFAQQGRSRGVQFLAKADFAGHEACLAGLQRAGMTPSHARLLLANVRPADWCKTPSRP